MRTIIDLPEQQYEALKGLARREGKSGGVRVIYFTRTSDGEVVLLTLYAKSKTNNLTGPKLKEIRRALEE